MGTRSAATKHGGKSPGKPSRGTKDSLRESGSELLGPMPWGTHFCQFYESKQDLLDILVPYFAAGLKNNEFCMWITAAPLESRQAERALSEAVPDLKERKRRGQIEILRHDRWCARSGRFDAKAALNGWVEKEAWALTQGYEGLRVTGDTFWLEDKDRSAFLDYERTVDSVIGEHRMLAVCTYSLKQCALPDIIEVLDTHEFALVRNRGVWCKVAGGRRNTETALKSAETWYRMLFDEARDSILVLELPPDGPPIIRDANAAALRLHGYSRDELIGKPISFLDADENSASLTVERSRRLQGPEGATFEARHRRKDGSVFVAEASVRGMTIGGKLFAIDVSRDITERKKAEEALLEAQAFHDSTLNALSDVFFVFDPQGMFLRWNAAMRRVTGYNDEEISAMKPVDFIATEDRPRASAAIERVFRAGAASVAVDFLTKDGRLIPFDFAGSALKDSRGNTIGCVGVGRDRSERNRAEEALRQSEVRYRTLFEANTDGLLIADIETRQFRYANQAICRMLGYSEEELKTMGLGDIHPKDSLPTVMAEFEAQLRGDKFVSADLPCLRKDGKIFYVDISSARLTIDGRACRMGIFRDITERKRADAALRESETKHRIVADNTYDWEFWAAPEGRFVYVSPSCLRITGHSPEEFMADPECLSRLIHPDDRARYESHFSQAMQRRLAAEVEFRIVRPDGAVRWIGHVCQPVFDSEKRFMGIRGSNRDITEHKQADAALRASTEEFRTLAEAMPQIVWITRPDGWNIFFNQKWMDYTGLTLEESLGHGWNKPFHPDDQKRAWDAWQKATSENGIYSVESRLRRADGVYRWWLVRGVPMKDAAGNILKWYGTCTDIHDLKMAELEVVRANQVLGESQRRFSDLLDNVKLVSMMLDKEGRITYCNEYLLRLTGWKQEEVVGKNWFETFVPPELVDLKGPFFAALLAGKAEALHHENEILTRSGQRRLIRFDNMVLRSPAGDGIGTASIGEDVTELRRVDAAVSASEVRYRRLFEAARDGILILDAETGAIVDVNPFLVELLGFSREDLLEKKVWEIGAFKDVIANQDKFVELQSRGYVRYADLPLMSADGRKIAVEFVSNVYEVDQHRVIQCNIRDNTERKQAEGAQKNLQAQLAQAQKMEIVGRLAGGVAHDFNNLLTAIKGYGEFVLDALTAEDPKRADVVEILNAADRAAALTRQLLAFSRRQILAPQVVDINKIVGDMTNLLGRLLGEDVKLVTELAPAPCLAKVDPGQTEQVIMNLAVNARDAMPKGGTITLVTEIATLHEDFFTAHPDLRRGPLVCLRVRDTGSGMSDEVKSHIFEPFFTTKEKGKGTGLGLSTVFGIIKQSGGEIALESSPGSGTTFQIYFPQMETAAPEKEKEKEKPVRGHETILLVEDEDVIRRMGERILVANGYTVLTAADGQEALKVLERHANPVDLLVTDVVMPGMNGRELAREIARRKMAPRTLFTSGYTDDAIVRHGVLEPGLSFLYKPFSPDGLLRKLREVLDGPADQAKA